MYRALNVKKKTIAQFACKLLDESFEPNDGLIRLNKFMSQFTGGIYKFMSQFTGGIYNLFCY